MGLFSKDITREILERHIDDDFSLFACGDNAPTKSEISGIGDKYRCKLPVDFRIQATSDLGGIYIEAKETVWPRAKEFDVAPFWTFLYGLFVYGYGDEVPEWMNIDLAARDFQDGTGQVAIPFLKIIGDADVYCFDESGQVVRWNHEINELEATGHSFASVFEEELAELVKRKEKMKTAHESEAQ